MADYWTSGSIGTGPNFCAQYPTDPICNSYGSKTIQAIFANASANNGTWTPTNGGIVPPGFPGTQPPGVPATQPPGPGPGQVINVTEPYTPWYKKWWGIGAIAVVGIFAASKLMKK